MFKVTFVVVMASGLVFLHFNSYAADLYKCSTGQETITCSYGREQSNQKISCGRIEGDKVVVTKTYDCDYIGDREDMTLGIMQDCKFPHQFNESQWLDKNYVCRWACGLCPGGWK